MGSQLSTELVSAVSAPIQRDVELERFISSVVAVTYTNGTIETVRDLTVSERKRLIARMNTLIAALKPGARAEALRAVVKMLSSYPQVNGKSGAKQIAEAYMEAVKDSPSWAIIIACTKFIMGQPMPELEGFNWSFAPTPPQLAIVSRSQALLFRDELAKISSVLNAKKFSSPERTGPRLSMEELRQRYFDRCGTWPEWGQPKRLQSATDPDDDLNALCAKYGVDRDEVERVNKDAAKTAASYRKFVPSPHTYVADSDYLENESKRRVGKERLTQISMKVLKRERAENNMAPVSDSCAIPVSAALTKLVKAKMKTDVDE